MAVILLLFLASCIVRIQGQIGITTCTFATHANCPNFLANSYCDLNSLTCECPAFGGYVDDGSQVACTYDCQALAAPTDGAVDTTDGTFTGDVATFSCNNGYRVDGGATSTCVRDSGWDNTATTCAPGQLGDDCSADIFLCSNIVNGDCENFDTCQCQAGYEDDGSALACTEIDECLTLSPCQNGSTCTDLVNDYSCTCVAGFEGDDCEIEIDECLTLSPCQNGGTCTDLVNDYSCTCVAGFGGKDCEIEIDECLTLSPCQNGGTCTDLVNDYWCLCVAGFGGKDCGLGCTASACCTRPAIAVVVLAICLYNVI